MEHPDYTLASCALEDLLMGRKPLEWALELHSIMPIIRSVLFSLHLGSLRRPVNPLA